MTEHERYMRRCLSLAALSSGFVAPNPMVGAVLVMNGQLIGEGYHEYFGGPHAEPNCIADAKKRGFEDLSQATLYVSLEPCAHFGKTPPCADLIVREKIRRVVIGCRDPFPQVDGRGVAVLRAAGAEVIENVLRAQCRELNKRFFCFHENGRPYIILKWAQTADGFAGIQKGRLKISSAAADVYVHHLRAREAAILVGYRTATQDDPLLNVRHVRGKDPVRVVLDPENSLSSTLKIFSSGGKLIVINDRIDEQHGDVKFVRTSGAPQEICAALYAENILSVIIEGGPATHSAFIEAGLWDEAIVITAPSKQLEKAGVPAAVLKDHSRPKTISVDCDHISIYRRSFKELP